ncbi:TolC family protein [Tenacibaculum sp. MAR_2009_124]|uniref:TolC family protein n=1 Tax=Tenacibaculum sp. MAR_2009_124 TaxID=1250059 RepID=UPI000B80334D|nr:TolC family protein [Tenacibaculum sp. MAR_2009_124]
MRKIQWVFVCLCLFFGLKSEAQELQMLINKALENSPRIQQIEKKYERTLERKKEVNTLPNTEIGAGVFVSTPETRTGAQRFKLSAKQMIPWFGTITARENYIKSLSEASYQEIVITKRKLVNSVTQLYYKLYESKAKQKVLEENRKLLETYEKLALTSLEVDKASAVDVLKLQIRQNEIIQQKEILQEQFLGEQASLNKMLNREADVSIKVPESIGPIEKFKVINVDNLKVHPELVKYDKLYASVMQSELLNKKNEKPLIGFGIDYINVEERPNMNFNDNGKDIIMPMVSVSIPLFNNKNKSLSKQNRLQQEEISFQKQERKNVLEATLKNAIAKQKAAVIAYQTNAKNLGQAKSAEQILLKSYETGIIEFNDVLDIQELQLRFQMNMITSVVNYYEKRSLINYLIK